MKAFDLIKNLFSFSQKSDSDVDAGWRTSNRFSNLNTRSLSKGDYYKYFKSWTYVAITTVANDFASLNYNLFKSDGNTGEIVNHDHLKLITYSLMQYTAAYMKVNGNAYWLLTRIGKKVTRIDMLDPVYVTKKFNNGIATHYEYTIDGRLSKFKPEDVIDFHNMNLYQPYPRVVNGMSDIEAIAQAVQTDSEVSDWNLNYFRNGAQPAGYLSTENELSADQTEMLGTQWNQKYGGTKNSHKTPVLSGGLEYKTINISQKDMDFIEQRRFSRDEILGIFKVPRAILGLGDGVNLNVGTFERIYAKRTLLPLAVQIADRLNETLFKDIGYFQFINVVPVDIEQVTSDWNAGIITLNEARTARGYDPLDEGDVLKTPSPAFAFGKEATDGSDTDTIKQKSMAFSLMKVSKSIKKEQIEQVSDSKISETIKSAVTKAIRKSVPGTEEYNEEMRVQKIKRNDDYESNYRNKLLIIFNQQEKDIINQFKNQKSVNKDIKQIGLNATAYISMYYTLLKEEQERIFEKEGTLALRQVNSLEAFDLGADLKKWMVSNLKKFAKSVDSTTQEKIADTLIRIDTEGLTVEEGVKQLKNVFVDLKDNRANTIVRTETIRLASHAQQDAWKQSGVVKRKQWYTAIDERVCPYCDAMHGKTIDLDGTFFDKGDSQNPDGAGKVKYDYEDVGGAPLHPNCRCALIPLIT